MVVQQQVDNFKLEQHNVEATSTTHQYGISDILFDVLYFLFPLGVGKSVDMQYSHLFYDC